MPLPGRAAQKEDPIPGDGAPARIHEGGGPDHDDLLRLLLSPRSTLPLLAYLGKHASPSPTKAMRAMGVGKSGWYDGLARLKEFEAVTEPIYYVAGVRRAPSLSERGERLLAAVAALRSALNGTEVYARSELANALEAGHLQSASRQALLLARGLIYRGKHRALSGIIAHLPRFGLEFERGLIGAQLGFAQNGPTTEDPEAVGPGLDPASAPTPLGEALLRLHLARALESCGKLNESFAQISEPVASDLSSDSAFLQGDAHLLRARLKLKSGNVRDALHEGWTAIEWFSSCADWFAWAEAQNLELAGWLMKDPTTAVAFRDTYGARIERLPPSPPVAEHLALASLLEGFRGHRTAGRDLLAASQLSDAAAFSWCARARLASLWCLARDELHNATAQTPQRLQEVLSRWVASTP